MGLIDSHAHLTFPELRDRLDEILTRCDDSGIDRIITLGIDLDDARSAVRFARLHPDRVHAAGAFHPHEAEKVTDDLLTAMAELWDDHAVVALGEMGLDYHHDFAAQDTQRSIFARQLELAAPRSKPLIIHCREAFADTVPMLVEHGFDGRPVVFHCFTGSTAEALRLQEHGWRISFTGVVTFPKSTELQQIAKSYPHKALMIETDSPYLSPVPVRGKQPNEPAHLVHTAQFLADLRGVSYQELARQTARNTMRFFDL
jgi:TatD DNase family protein